MTTPYFRFCWKLGNDVMQRVEHGFVITFLEIRSSNAHLKQSVASKRHFLFFTEECQTAWCMTGGFQNLKRVTPKVNHIILVDKSDSLRHTRFHLKAKVTLRLSVKTV